MCDSERTMSRGGGMIAKAHNRVEPGDGQNRLPQPSVEEAMSDGLSAPALNVWRVASATGGRGCFARAMSQPVRVLSCLGAEHLLIRLKRVDRPDAADERRRGSHEYRDDREPPVRP